MMKKLLKFFNDSVLVIALFFITVTAFLGTYALSPVAFEKSVLARDYQKEPVLGEVDSKYLEFENIYEEHDYFKVVGTPVNGTYKALIKIGPVRRALARNL